MHDAMGHDAVKGFVAWLRSEVRRDGKLTLALPDVADRLPVRRAQSTIARTRARRR
jgi:hypothetical protein